MGLCASSDAPSKDPSPGQVKPEGSDVRKARTSDLYVEGKTLGNGASCRVVVVKSKSNQKNKFAMKVLLKPDKTKPETLDNDHLFRNEVKILRSLNHKRVVQLCDAYEDDADFRLVFALYTGGELFDKVSVGSFTEKAASNLTLQMLEALQYCHSHQVVHRDLKPENFVFEDEGEEMRLIDFGCAVKAADDEVIEDVAGSPYYVAPEVLQNRMQRTGLIWKAADMWSVGVIIYLLVCGYPPFNGQDSATIFDKIKQGKFRFPQKKGLSPQVQDIITKLLVANPLNRLTVDQALKHPWILEAPDNKISAETVEQLGRFNEATKIKKAVARAMAGQTSDADRGRLAKAFKKYDKNGDGKLDAGEIAAMMADMSKSAAGEGDPDADYTQEAKNLISIYDADKDGNIDMKEFEKMQKEADVGNQLSGEKQARQAFLLIDRDGNGKLSPEEVAKFLRISPTEAKDLIHDVDKDGDGEVDLDEWIKAMGIMQNKGAGRGIKPM